jgi:hypothetical protein
VALPEGDAVAEVERPGERDTEGEAVGVTEPRAVRVAAVESDAAGDVEALGGGVLVEKGSVGDEEEEAEGVSDPRALALALAQGDAEVEAEGEGDCVPVAPPPVLAEGLPLSASEGVTLPEALTVGVAVTVAVDVPLWQPVREWLREPDRVTEREPSRPVGEGGTEGVVDRDTSRPREPDTVEEARPVPVGATAERV